MHYFKPAGNFFAGDCMPYFHDGVFHLYYLLDENHHQALNGLGGHQWAHASTTDLVHWTHHPLALPISDAQEGSICTGAVFFHEGRHYAFYATRALDWSQRLSLAVSDDAVHFVKINTNLFFPPQPDYSPLHFRDPFPFQDPETGLFHLLVSAQLAHYPVVGRGGCLAHLTSPDLTTWTLQEPFLIPGYDDVPECSDYFFWNGWYYLIFSSSLTAHYRMSRYPLGPWLRPPVDTLDGALGRVMKTAPFVGDRRIGAAWLGTRVGDKDDGKPQWGGHVLLRELIQHSDGTLGSKFAPEMIPVDRHAAPLTLQVDEPGADQGKAIDKLRLRAWHSLQVVGFRRLPHNVCITLRIIPEDTSATFGLRLRAADNFASGYDLTFRVPERLVELHHETIYAVDGLHRPFLVEVILKDDIIDVCIDNRRCLVNRCPELHGNHLFFFAQNADVVFDEIEIRPLY